MTIPIYQIDAFTNEAFRGNPAAVVFIDEQRSDDWMQSVASEMNLSETAYVRHLKENRYQLRWFTPAMEVELCGHATVASAHALWSSGRVSEHRDIVFESQSGALEVKWIDGQIQLNFPATPPRQMDLSAELLECFFVDGSSVSCLYAGRSKFDFLIELQQESDVRSLEVDFRLLAQCKCRGVIVTAKADQDQPFDFVSRFFAPAAGVDEDPVTGSAHCCLAVFWSEKLERSVLTGFQASERGGMVDMTLEGDRVLLSGHAVTVFSGDLLV